MSRYESGQKHGRTAPNGTYDELDTVICNIANIEDGPTFCSNPSDYIWRYVSKRKTIIPYNCDALPQPLSEDLDEPEFSNTKNLRWEMHDLLVVEGILRVGESNLLTRRCFYIEEKTWAILFGEGYDISENVVKCYMLSGQIGSNLNKHGRWYSHKPPLSRCRGQS